jgi:hypothetical protein
MRPDIMSDVAVSTIGGSPRCAVAAYPVPCPLGAGALLCVYRQGSEKHSLDGTLVAQRSTDGGASWSGEVVIFDGMGRDPPESVHTGAACRIPDGRICAFFTTVEATKPDTYVFSEAGKKLPLHFYISESTNGGRTWCTSTEHRLEGAPRNYYIGVRPVVMTDGRLLIPVEALGKRGQSMVLAAISLDSGRTVRPAIAAVADPAGEIGYGDPRLALLDDGAIVMLLWAYRQATEKTLAVHRCVSTDSGRTWSPPASTFVESQIMAPISLGSGNMIAASTVRTGRHGIRLWFSRDRGETWESDSCIQMWDPYEEKLLGTAIAPERSTSAENGEKIWAALPGFTFGYPDLVHLGGNTFLLTYYATMKGITHVRACRFALSRDRE